MWERRIGWRDFMCLRLTDNDRYMILLELLKRMHPSKGLGGFGSTASVCKQKGLHQKYSRATSRVAERAKRYYFLPWSFLQHPSSFSHTHTRHIRLRLEKSLSDAPTLFKSFSPFDTSHTFPTYNLQPIFSPENATPYLSYHLQRRRRR